MDSRAAIPRLVCGRMRRTRLGGVSVDHQIYALLFGFNFNDIHEFVFHVALLAFFIIEIYQFIRFKLRR
jgi:hypothetical protein